MGRLPLRWRLTLGFAAGMTVVLLALGAFVHVRLRADLNESIDEGLKAQAEFVAAAADRGAPLSADDPQVDADDALAQLVDPSGAVLASASPLAEEPFLSREQLAASGPEVFVETLVPSRSLPVRAFASERADGSFVVVARTLDDRDEALSRLVVLLVGGGMAALVLATGLGWTLAGAALRPVERMRREADAISISEPDRRLTVPDPEDELRRLAETLNSMLERLQSSMRTEREFLDRASHELRTPLSVLKTELDLALERRRSPEELEEAVHRSADEVQTLVRLADDLLVASRSRGGRLPMRPERIRVDQLVEDIGRGFAEQGRSAGIEVHVEAGGERSIVADPIRLRQAISNLVVNALQYTPPGGRIDVEVAETERGLEFRVRDTGPGFDLRAEGEPSSGLGLVVADSVARAHGGSLEIGPTSPAGGGSAAGGLASIVLPGRTDPAGSAVGPRGD